MPLFGPDGTVDRIGGKILYRLIGCLVLIAALGTTWVAVSAFRSSDTITGVVLALIAAGLFWGVTWCFSGRRRLREADFE